MIVDSDSKNKLSIGRKIRKWYAYVLFILSRDTYASLFNIFIGQKQMKNPVYLKSQTNRIFFHVESEYLMKEQKNNKTQKHELHRNSS